MKPLALTLLLLIFIGSVGAKTIDSTKRIQASPTVGLIAFNGLNPATIALDRVGGYVDITAGVWSLGFKPAANQTMTLTGLNATTLTYTVNPLTTHTQDTQAAERPRGDNPPQGHA